MTFVLIWLRRIIGQSLVKNRPLLRVGPRPRHRCARVSEIGNLQKPAVADPDSGKVSLGLARRGGVAARLMQFRQPVVRPAVRWRSAERTLELSLRLRVAASLQQGSGKGLPNRIVPIWWLGVGQRVL